MLRSLNLPLSLSLSLPVTFFSFSLSFSVSSLRNNVRFFQLDFQFQLCWLSLSPAICFDFSGFASICFTLLLFTLFCFASLGLALALLRFVWTWQTHPTKAWQELKSFASRTRFLNGLSGDSDADADVGRGSAKKPPATATVASFPSAVAPTVIVTALPGRLTLPSDVNSTRNRDTPKAFRVPFRSKL